MSSSLLDQPPWRAILRFLGPLWLGNLLQQSYNVVDGIIVGRFIGEQALAAIGAALGVTAFLLGLAWAFAAGLAIPVTHAIGAGDTVIAGTMFCRGAITAAIVSSTGAVALLMSSRAIIDLLAVPPLIVGVSTSFFVISILGMPVLVLANYFTSVIRGMGNTHAPTLIFAVSGAANAIGALLAVTVLRAGVSGVALVTVAAQLLSAWMSWLWLRRHGQFPVRRPGRGWLRDTRTLAQLSQGGAVAFQACGVAVGGVILQVAINKLGPDQIAGLAVGLRVEALAMPPLASFGICMVAFCAQNSGAQRPERVGTGMRQAVLLATVLAAVEVGVILSITPSIVALFLGSSLTPAAEVAMTYLRWSSPFYPIVAALFATRGALQGLGRKTAPVASGLGELTAKLLVATITLVTGSVVCASISGPASWALGLVPLVIAWSRIHAKGQRQPVDGSRPALDLEGG